VIGTLRDGEGRPMSVRLRSVIVPLAAGTVFVAATAGLALAGAADSGGGGAASAAIAMVRTESDTVDMHAGFRWGPVTKAADPGLFVAVDLTCAVPSSAQFVVRFTPDPAVPPGIGASAVSGSIPSCTPGSPTRSSVYVGPSDLLGGPTLADRGTIVITGSVVPLDNPGSSATPVGDTATGVRCRTCEASAGPPTRSVGVTLDRTPGEPVPLQPAGCRLLSAPAGAILPGCFVWVEGTVTCAPAGPVVVSVETGPSRFRPENVSLGTEVVDCPGTARFRISTPRTSDQPEWAEARVAALDEFGIVDASASDRTDATRCDSCIPTPPVPLDIGVGLDLSTTTASGTPAALVTAAPTSTGRWRVAVGGTVTCSAPTRLLVTTDLAGAQAVVDCTGATRFEAVADAATPPPAGEVTAIVTVRTPDQFGIPPFVVAPIWSATAQTPAVVEVAAA
jgi:hypothetical protein